MSKQARQAIHDSEADPKALNGPVGLFVAPVKLTEDLTELIRRYADAGIPDL